ncbi:MAG: exodeoxyribonuclease VII large subunit [Spirochaetales bacterium]|nr:exodeoxyribonuclease VII large subunit [Spirochaetales bacterium]
MAELFDVPLSVSELTALIKKTLEEGFYGLTVTGEISNFRPSSTGHWFFTLKDEGASISAVMFKGSTWRVDFSPKEGDRVVINGSLDVYAARGSYQIKVETMTLAGYGEILAELERRKRRFLDLGYFAEERKRPIPAFPQRLGVVTSPTGAALQDILTVLGRRAPGLDVLVLPAVVQGESAAASIAARIRQANSLLLCDVLIVSRGGGSVEDLLPFSDEAVVKEIAQSQIPIVSGIGHEVDFALADFAADLRAPTPSAAAELVSASYAQLRERVESLAATLRQRTQSRLSIAEAHLARGSRKSLAQRTLTLFGSKEFLLANATRSLTQQIEQRLASWEARLVLAGHRLEALSPLAVLERGYAVVQDLDGRVIASREGTAIGEQLDIRFIDGKRRVSVEEDP